MATKFTLPTTFQKDIAATTQKVYKGKLNILAKHGFDTVESLKKRAKDVIETIKQITGISDDDKARHARRYFISAIFWVTKMPKRNRYYTYYQKCLPLKVLGTDDDWVRKTRFTPLNAPDVPGEIAYL